MNQKKAYKRGPLLLYIFLLLFVYKSNSMQCLEKFFGKQEPYKKCLFATLPEDILQIIAEYCLYNQAMENFKNREEYHDKPWWGNCHFESKKISVKIFSHSIQYVFKNNILPNKKMSIQNSITSESGAKYFIRKPICIDRKNNQFSILSKNGEPDKEYLAYTKKTPFYMISPEKSLLTMVPLKNSKTVIFLYPCQESNLVVLFLTDHDDSFNAVKEVKYLALDAQKQIKYDINTFLKNKGVCKSLKSSLKE